MGKRREKPDPIWDPTFPDDCSSLQLAHRMKSSKQAKQKWDPFTKMHLFQNAPFQDFKRRPIAAPRLTFSLPHVRHEDVDRTHGGPAMGSSFFAMAWWEKRQKALEFIFFAGLQTTTRVKNRDLGWLVHQLVGSCSFVAVSQSRAISCRTRISSCGV